MPKYFVAFETLYDTIFVRLLKKVTPENKFLNFAFIFFFKVDRFGRLCPITNNCVDRKTVKQSGFCPQPAGRIFSLTNLGYFHFRVLHISEQILLYQFFLHLLIYLFSFRSVYPYVYVYLCICMDGTCKSYAYNIIW